MNELKAFETLKEAYETSTQNHNRFKEVLESFNWDDVFTVDGLITYISGGFTLEVFNADGVPNPFTEWNKPEAMFSDYSVVSF